MLGFWMVLFSNIFGQNGCQIRNNFVLFLFCVFQNGHHLVRIQVVAWNPNIFSFVLNGQKNEPYKIGFSKHLVFKLIQNSNIPYLSLHCTTNILYQGNLIQGEGSNSLKTALETRGKTALWYAAIYLHYSKLHTFKLVKLSSLWSPNRFFQFFRASWAFPCIRFPCLD